jgi:hypothetical protein
MGCSSNKKEDVREEIQAALDQCVLAVNTKNIALYMEGIPEAFQIKDENGNLITKEMQRRLILRDWAIIDTTLSNSYVIDSLEVRGDSAVVITSQAWKRIMFRKDGRTTDTVITTQTHREIWRRINRAWRTYEIKELGGKVFLNGKEYIE